MPLTSGLFFASGLAALLYQIAWQRMLFEWFRVDLDSVSMIFSIFMLGFGDGALIGGWLADSFPKRCIFALRFRQLQQPGLHAKRFTRVARSFGKCQC